MIRKFLPTIIILLAVAGIAVAGNCRQFFRQTYVAPVVAQAYVPYVQPQVYYGVGSDLQIEAIVKKTVREEFQAIRQELAAARQQPVVQPETVPASTSALAQNCAKCHSGAEPKAGLTFDGRHEIPCSSITAALRAIASGKMPKGKVISGEIKGQIMEELLDSEPKPAEELPPHPAPPRPPVPPAPSPDLE